MRTRNERRERRREACWIAAIALLFGLVFWLGFAMGAAI